MLVRLIEERSMAMNEEEITSRYESKQAKIEGLRAMAAPSHVVGVS